MVASYQAVGFLVFCGILAVFFRQSLMSALARPMAWFTSLTAMLPGKRLTMLIGLLTGLSAICWFGRMELKVSAESRIMPVHNAEVRAEVEGLIAEVFVDKGDEVRPGDPIARLDDEVYVAQLRRLEAEIGEARASLKMLQAGARFEEIELANRELQTAQTRADHAAQRFDSARKLHDEQILKSQTTIDKLRHQLASAEAELEWVRQLTGLRAISPKELRDAESTVVLRQKELKEAQADLAVLSADDLAQFREAMVVAERATEEPRARLELLLAGTRPELIEATQAKIAALDAQCRHVEEQIRLLRINSPIAGVVTTHRLKEKVGQLVERGQLIGSVHAVKTVTLEIALPEQEIADVCVGQKVILKARAYPLESFEGNVTGIAPIAATEEEWHTGKSILVTAQLDNAAGLLRSEMTGNAKIYCGERRILDIITRRFVRYLRVEFWSWW
jgi:multidrug resistance efflux pump